MFNLEKLKIFLGMFANICKIVFFKKVEVDIKYFCDFSLKETEAIS